MPIFYILSSTYSFQNFGLHSTGAVAIACFSSHSINKFARSGETGLPTAAPNICWYMTAPEKEARCCHYELQLVHNVFYGEACSCMKFRIPFQRFPDNL